MRTVKPTTAAREGQIMVFEQDGKPQRATYTYYRGERAHFYPADGSLDAADFVARYFMQGLAPPEPFLDPRSVVVAFGSCFAGHISKHLKTIGYNVATKMRRAAYVARMGDGIVNTFAIRQQFEWAWENRTPAVGLWHGYDAKALGYDDDVRRDTEALFDGADAFIVTLGLSEVWYDEPTGEVFWRAVPVEYFDASRHKFRVASFSENLANLEAIRALIRKRRPGAAILFTLSPVPLTATFRPIACTVADGASKANLRAALDELLRRHEDVRYFPSYELVLRAFEHPFMEDRKHPHKHVLDFNMAVFERYYCRTGLTDADVTARFRDARVLDARVVREGHWAVPRDHLLSSKPPSE